MKKLRGKVPRRAGKIAGGPTMTSDQAARLTWIETGKLVGLRRNPQYLTPHQMESLKRSIERDGFLAPILVRALANGSYEIISGNHRAAAARELGMEKIPCVIANLDDRAAKRVAINLNSVHGEPSPELMAPFLAELDDELLKEIHIEDGLLQQIFEFEEATPR